MTKPKYGPYEFMIRYDQTERKLIFVVNGEKHVWDIRELHEKEAAHTADLGTRYRYRQEGAEAERERLIKKFESVCRCGDERNELTCLVHWAILVINSESTNEGEQK